MLSLVLLVAALFASSAQAASIDLGSAKNFSVLANTTVTNTGPSVLTGDLGLSPHSSVTGFPPGTVNGTFHVNDQVALDAQADLGIAYNDAAGRSSTETISADLAGRTLNPGVYTSNSSMGLTGDLTLDAKGDPNAVWVFQAGSTLTTASGSRVLLTGGAQACNVFWQVGSSATINSSTAFTGSILAYTSISLKTSATVDGRALARNGAVTLDTNTVTRATCATTGGGGSGGTTGGSTNTRAVAFTKAASHLGFVTARLAGEVHPGSTRSTYYFQFGTSRRYGHHTATHTAAPGTKTFRVRSQLGRLHPGTTYHYRIVLVSSTGHKRYGTDTTFRTRAHHARPARTPARTPVTNGGFTG
jgi:hypothetical protein